MIRELNVTNLLPDSPIRKQLRKPEFQRESNHWSPDQACRFLVSFIDGAVIPSIILWRSTNFIFVIDGAHPSQWSKERKIEYLSTHTDEQYRALIQSPVLDAGVKTMDPNMSRKDYSNLTRSEKIAFLREFGSDAASRIMQKKS